MPPPFSTSWLGKFFTFSRAESLADDRGGDTTTDFESFQINCKIFQSNEKRAEGSPIKYCVLVGLVLGKTTASKAIRHGFFNSRVLGDVDPAQDPLDERGPPLQGPPRVVRVRVGVAVARVVRVQQGQEVVGRRVYPLRISIN